MHRLYPGPTAELDRDGLTAAYAWPEPTASGAHVRANFVLTADGAVELGGSSRPLSGPADQRVLSLLRGLCDVVLVGASTVRQENYGPARPDPARQEWRRRHGQRPVPPIAVVSGRLALDPGSRLFAEAVVRPLVITTTAAAAGGGGELGRVADVVAVGAAEVSAADIVQALVARGLRRVLCEGGPRLFGQLLAAGLVDELCLTVSPLLAGAAPARLVPAQLLPVPVELDLRQVLTAQDMLFLRYVVRR